VRAADERDVRLEGEYDEFMNEVKGPQGAPAPWKTAAQGPSGMIVLSLLCLAPWAAAGPPGVAAMMGMPPGMGYYPPSAPGFVSFLSGLLLDSTASCCE
jgi:hypothetical protein